jgi:hypothetical protein
MDGRLRVAWPGDKMQYRVRHRRIPQYKSWLRILFVPQDRLAGQVLHSFYGPVRPSAFSWERGSPRLNAYPNSVRKSA